jgi:hypothetical protein
VVKSLFYNVVLGSQIPQRMIIPTEVLTADAVAEDWALSQPTLWGHLTLKEVPFENWPVLKYSRPLRNPYQSHAHGTYGLLIPTDFYAHRRAKMSGTSGNPEVPSFYGEKRWTGKR